MSSDTTSMPGFHGGNFSSDMPEYQSSNHNSTLEMLTNCSLDWTSGPQASVSNCLDGGHAGLTSPDPQVLARTILVGILLSLFVVVALVGNILVIVAIITDRHLRHMSNYFLASLALADSLVAIAVMTFAIVNDILGRWIFGSVFCNVWLFSDIMCSTASILSLCAVTLDRYVQIRYPFQYEKLVTHRKALTSIAIIWILSALISFLPIHLNWHQYTPEQPPTPTPSSFNNSSTSPTPTSSISPGPPPSSVSHCTLDLNPVYAIVSSIISFYLPCLAMIFIYVRMHQYARKHADSIKRYSAGLSRTESSVAPKGSARPGPTSTVAAYSAVNGDDSPLNQGRRILRRKLIGSNGSSKSHRLSDHKASITVGIIMGVFLLCWAPFFSINVIHALCGHCVSPDLFAALTWLGYANSTMNPIIYSVFNRQFRNAFKKLLMISPLPESCRCCVTNSVRPRLNRDRCTGRFTSGCARRCTSGCAGRFTSGTIKQDYCPANVDECVFEEEIQLTKF